VADSLRGWKDIFWRTYQRINDNRLLAVAAGAVFYGLLALFPGITALVSLYGCLPAHRRSTTTLVDGRDAAR
jgi:membrane protein